MPTTRSTISRGLTFARVRTPKDGLGKWHAESRRLWDDMQTAYGARAARAVRLWLIANTVFQRRRGLATVRDLGLTEES